MAKTTGRTAKMLGAAVAVSASFLIVGAAAAAAAPAHVSLSAAQHQGAAQLQVRQMAMTELNLAVLHSFSADGVTITDHHTESVRFLQHLDKEERQGRACPADWSWIVPATTSSATPVFHRYYEDFNQTPNFYRHPVSLRLKSATP
jgi:nitric oxide synthase oxygenase domain/subunit